MSHFDDGALHAYLDGELAPVERAQIEAHIAECAACRTRLDEERVLIQRASHLLGLVQPPPPERAALPLHQLRHPRPAWRLRMPLTWAASVVLALAVGYYAGGSSFRSAPDEAESDAVAGVATAPAPVSTGLSDRSAAEQARRQRSPRPPAAPAAPDPAQAFTEKAREPTVQIDGNIYGARRDTAGAAAGAMASRLQAERRPAAPLALTDVVVTAAGEADRTAARDRQETTSWPVIERDVARQLLGGEPVGVPGLAVREMRHSPAGNAPPIVLVEQQVDSTTVIQLFQRRAEQPDVGRRVVIRGAVGAARAAAPDARATERLARFVGSLRVEIAGPLTSDSLNKLLEQLRPIP